MPQSRRPRKPTPKAAPQASPKPVAGRSRRSVVKEEAAKLLKTAVEAATSELREARRQADQANQERVEKEMRRAERLARRNANLPAKPLPGLGIQPAMRSPFVHPSWDQQRLVGSREARYGRAFGRTGPGPLYWNRNFEITIENIARVHSETEHIGWCWHKADLDQRMLREEAHLRQADRSIRVRILNSPVRLKAAGPGRLAELVCNAVQATMDQLDGFKRSAAELLVAAGSGYGLQEITWKPRTLTVPVGDFSLNIASETVERLDMIQNRSVLFDIVTDRPWVMQDTAPGKEVDPFEDPETCEPTYKAVLLTDIAVTGEPIRMRGYQYAAHLLGYIKGLAWERGGITLETYGVATPYAEFDPLTNPTDEQFERAKMAAGDVGKGQPTVAHGFKLNATNIPPSLANLHQQFIGMINAEFSKLVTSQTLAMETGGVGSYNASDTHMDQQEAVQQMWAQLLGEAYRGQLLRFIVAINAERWARAFAPYCPGEDCSPAAIRARVPHFGWDVRRKETRTERLKMFIDAKSAGWAPAARQVYEECDLQRETAAPAAPTPSTPQVAPAAPAAPTAEPAPAPSLPPQPA